MRGYICKSGKTAKSEYFYAYYDYAGDISKFASLQSDVGFVGDSFLDELGGFVVLVDESFNNKAGASLDLSWVQLGVIFALSNPLSEGKTFSDVDKRDLVLFAETLDEFQVHFLIAIVSNDAENWSILVINSFANFIETLGDGILEQTSLDGSLEGSGQI